MKKHFKIFGHFILCLATISLVSYLYIFREQTIDVDFIPSEFVFCGKTIYGSDHEYVEIVNWLNQNKDGWVLSYVSYVPGQMYRYPSFVVNLLDDTVIVSYKTDYGYPQFVKSIKHNLGKQCSKSS